jgi:hypothetical protein
MGRKPKESPAPPLGDDPAVRPSRKRKVSALADDAREEEQLAQITWTDAAVDELIDAYIVVSSDQKLTTERRKNLRIPGWIAVHSILAQVGTWCHTCG